MRNQHTRHALVDTSDLVVVLGRAGCRLLVFSAQELCPSFDVFLPELGHDVEDVVRVFLATDVRQELRNQVIHFLGDLDCPLSNRRALVAHASCKDASHVMVQVCEVFCAGLACFGDECHTEERMSKIKVITF